MREPVALFLRLRLVGVSFENSLRSEGQEKGSSKGRRVLSRDMRARGEIKGHIKGGKRKISGMRWGRSRFMAVKRDNENVRFESKERELVRDVPLPKHHLVNLIGQPCPVQ